jgi:hypothetical protein
MANSRCELLFQIFVVDLLRGSVLESGVATSGIVPEFDVPDDVAAGVLTGRVFSTVNSLILQGGEERLCHRVIVAYTGAAR